MNSYEIRVCVDRDGLPIDMWFNVTGERFAKIVRPEPHVELVDASIHGIRLRVGPEDQKRLAYEIAIGRRDALSLFNDPESNLPRKG